MVTPDIERCDHTKFCVWMFTDIKIFPAWRKNQISLNWQIVSTHCLLLRSKKGEIIDTCGHLCETPENVNGRLKKNLNFRCLYKIHTCVCDNNHKKLGYQLESWEDMVGDGRRVAGRSWRGSRARKCDDIPFLIKSCKKEKKVNLEMKKSHKLLNKEQIGIFQELGRRSEWVE